MIASVLEDHATSVFSVVDIVCLPRRWYQKLLYSIGNGCKITWLHSPEDHKLNTDSNENFKSLICDLFHKWKCLLSCCKITSMIVRAASHISHAGSVGSYMLLLHSWEYNFSFSDTNYSTKLIAEKCYCVTFIWLQTLESLILPLQPAICICI
jgi:hypothetical protein